MTQARSAEAPASDPLGQLTSPPIFVVGLHRSGTTWVYDMLTAHPEVAGIFESGIFSLNLGVAPLFDPKHWYSDEGALDRDRALFGSAFRLNQLIGRDELLRDVRELTTTWIGRAHEPQHRFLVEKTPQHFRTMRLIDELYPGATFVHVIRDGRDVAVSVQEAGHSWPAPRLRGLARREIAQRWVEGIGIARQQAREGQLRYVEVRYEEFHRDPAAELRRLFAFCAIPADEDTIARICKVTAFDSQQRAHGDQFRRQGAVGDWRRRFGIRDRLMFDRVAGELIVELGYEENRRWWLSPRPGRRDGAAR